METLQPNRKPPTLAAVAERAGVNKNTASIVLNGSRGNTRVSDATRQRIRQAAAEMGFYPSALARSLRERRTNIVGFYSGYGYINAQSPFFSDVIGGLQEACDGYQLDLLLHGIFRGRSVTDIVAELKGGKIDGLVITPGANDPLVEQIAASDLPVVAIADPVPALPSVTVDDAQGAELVAELLAAQGHQRVLFRGSDDGLASVRRRREAFLRAASERGMEVTVSTPAEVGGRLSDAEQELLLRPRGERPTAVFCWYDIAAYHTLNFCHRHGLRVPEYVAVVGFDGDYRVDEYSPRLTTVNARWNEVAKTALHVLVARMEGRDVPPETILPVTLIRGNTV